MRKPWRRNQSTHDLPDLDDVPSASRRERRILLIARIVLLYALAATSHLVLLTTAPAHVYLLQLAKVIIAFRIGIKLRNAAQQLEDALYSPLTPDQRRLNQRAPAVSVPRHRV